MPSKALPMAPVAYAQWCRACALATSTCDYLSTIRGSEAARRVTSRANNVSGAYPSRKMGVTIQFESQNPELWAIVMMDHDESVLEFFEQPDTFKIRYLDKSGKKMRGHYYTPDFLVFRNDSVCFEEWKREDDLKRLAARYPFRYQPQEDGSWRYPPAEEAVASLGIPFRVRSSAELHSMYTDNLLNPGDTTTTLLPEKGAPIQIPSDFFFQLLDTGVITRLSASEDPPVSPEVDRLMDRATQDDQRQAAIRFEKVMPTSVERKSATPESRRARCTVGWHAFEKRKNGSVVATLACFRARRRRGTVSRKLHLRRAN